MKFECKGTIFVKALQQVAKARSKTKLQEILQNIHCEVEDHILILRATNLEFFCEKSIPVKGVMNGTCLLHGETLLRIMTSLSSLDTIITCEVIEGVFTITTEKGVIDIKVTSYEDFPKLPSYGNEIGSISLHEFSSLIKEVSFCSAHTEIKPEISSVYLYSKDTMLYAVATDSYRLAEKSIPNTTQLDISILIPEKHIGDILQILQEEEGDITLSVYESILTITSPTCTVSLHTITGHFPDYRQLFPKEFTTIITISKEELQKTLVLTTLFNEHYSQVECVFTGTVCTLHSKHEKIGQITYSLPITKEGDDIEAKYNNKFFIETLPYFEGDTIIARFTTPNRPMFLQSTKNTNFTYLLMPLTR